MKINQMTVKELYKLAQERNLEGRSKMNKSQLIQALSANTVTETATSHMTKVKELLSNKKQQAKQKSHRKQFNKVGLNLQFFAQDNIFTQGLNDNQKEAVETINGTIQICSVAGSGKTRVLTNRTAHMIKNEGISPLNIMLTTFTAKASKEMEERLESMITAKELENLTVGTTHSIGLSILKDYKEYTEFETALSNLYHGLLQGWKQTKLVKDIIKQLEKKYARSFDMILALQQIKPPMFLKVISHFKNNNISCEECWEHGDNNGKKEMLYKDFYNMYEYEKKLQQKIDFDDMLFLCVRLLQENPSILKHYQNKFEYIMVDEGQDNNLIQYELVKMLAFPQNNLFLVGDDDQSMYKFRGASPESFIDFNKEYKNVKQIFLPLNYRSNKKILETANKLIHNNVHRIEKSLVPASKVDDESVFYNCFFDEDEEAEHIVRNIIEKESIDNINFKDMACLFRTNAQSRAIEDKLILKGVPYILHGGISFYDRAEVQDLVSYLRLAYDRQDNGAFKRIYNKPNRYLGNAFYDKVSKGKSHYETMRSTSNSFARNQQQGITDIVNIVENVDKISKSGEGLGSTVQFILNSGYKEWLLGEDFVSENDSPKLENIATLEYLLSTFDTLDEFMNHLNNLEKKKKEEEKNSVHLMTIHKSKGLEFNTVFVLGVNEGTLPHARAIEEDTDNRAIEEERRLCYVAVTRAEKECHISSTVTYNGKKAGESVFIAEMELEESEETENMQEEQTA